VDRNGQPTNITDTVEIHVDPADKKVYALFGRKWDGFAAMVMSYDLTQIGHPGMVLVNPYELRPDGEGKGMFMVPSKYLIRTGSKRR
jgi:hypothetical protein